MLMKTLPAALTLATFTAPPAARAGGPASARFALHDLGHGARAAIPPSKSKAGGALVNAVPPELQQRYGGWGWFQYFARHNIEQAAAGLDGTKRVPVPGKP